MVAAVRNGAMCIWKRGLHARLSVAGSESKPRRPPPCVDRLQRPRTSANQAASSSMTPQSESKGAKRNDFSGPQPSAAPGPLPVNLGREIGAPAMFLSHEAWLSHSRPVVRLPIRHPSKSNQMPFEQPWLIPDPESQFVFLDTPACIVPLRSSWPDIGIDIDRFSLG